MPQRMDANFVSILQCYADPLRCLDRAEVFRKPWTEGFLPCWPDGITGLFSNRDQEGIFCGIAHLAIYVHSEIGSALD